MPRRYFDEIEVGEEFETPGVTITEYHIMQFAGVSMDHHELHTNEEFAKKTQFGRRVAHGLLGLALTNGLKNRSEFQVHDFASLHWSWDFLNPVFIGDNLHVQLQVIDKRPSNTKPDRGVVTLALKLINQHGEVVQQGQCRFMVRRRPGL